MPWGGQPSYIDTGNPIFSRPGPDPNSPIEFPPGGQRRFIPLIPLEFPEHTSLAVRGSINDPEVKVVPGPLTYPELTELEVYKAGPNKNFYLESHELYFNVTVATALAQDMIERSKFTENKNLVERTAVVRKALLELTKEAGALLQAAAFHAYPGNEVKL